MWACLPSAWTSPGLHPSTGPPPWRSPLSAEGGGAEGAHLVLSQNSPATSRPLFPAPVPRGVLISSRLGFLMTQDTEGRVRSAGTPPRIGVPGDLGMSVCFPRAAMRQGGGGAGDGRRAQVGVIPLSREGWGGGVTGKLQRVTSCPNVVTGGQGPGPGGPGEGAAHPDGLGCPGPG